MSLIKLQEKIGATPDGSFGPHTLKLAMAYFHMSPERTAHFFGQCAHESAGFQVFVENLNYSAKGLLATFPNYFTAELAEKYARQPIKIASRVYANRMGNGDEASQEGWFYKGRGAIQLTGKDNFQAFSDVCGKPEIMTHPELVSDLYAFESALFYFNRRKLWGICDKGVNDATIKALTLKINGGTKGLAERNSLTKRYYKWLTT